MTADRHHRQAAGGRRFDEAFGRVGVDEQDAVGGEIVYLVVLAQRWDEDQRVAVPKGLVGGGQCGAGVPVQA